MYNIGGLIPTRFLSLLAHLVVSIALLWGSKQSVMSCLQMEVTEMEFRSQQSQLVVGLSLALGMIAFELLSFLSGVTMFNSTSALLSIGCHSSATIALTYFILDSWQCGWFWWVFVLCSVLPAVMDLCIVCDVFLRGKW